MHHSLYLIEIDPLTTEASKTLSTSSVLVDEGTKLQNALAGVRESATAGEDGLGDNTGEGKHGQSAVLDLLELHVVDGLLGLALEQANAKAKITGSPAAALKHGRDANPRGHLGHGDPNEEISQAAVRDEGVVGSGGGEPLPLLGKRVDASSEVDSDPTGPRQHADAAMLELGLAEVVHGKVLRDAKGVEANITDVALGVFRRREEGEGLRLLSGVERYRGRSAWRKELRREMELW